MLPVESFTIADIDSLYHLLEQSFPADEFRDYGGQRALFAHPRYHPCGLRDERGDVKALLTVWDFDTFVYIEHFAVSPAARNSGIGSALLQQVTAPMQKPVCLEVELPESDITRRRIGFYRRNGFFHMACAGRAAHAGDFVALGGDLVALHGKKCPFFK